MMPTVSAPMTVTMMRFDLPVTAACLIGRRTRRLVLVGELLARVDRERRVGRQDRIAADILVDEVGRVVGDVLAPERERLGIEREPLDDVQLGAMSDRPGEAAGLEGDRIDDERVAVPAADRVPGAARRDAVTDALRDPCAPSA